MIQFIGFLHSRQPAAITIGAVSSALIPAIRTNATNYILFSGHGSGEAGSNFSMLIKSMFSGCSIHTQENEQKSNFNVLPSISIKVAYGSNVHFMSQILVAEITFFDLNTIVWDFGCIFRTVHYNIRFGVPLLR